jgi:hypothetical protein
MLFLLMTLTCEAVIVGAAAPDVTVKSLDGDSLVGQLIDWTNEEVIVGGSSGTQKMQRADLEEIIFSPSPGAPSQVPSVDGMQVQLIDRSELPVQSFLVAGDKASIVWEAGDSQTMPLSLVRSLNLVAADERLDKAWKRLRDKPRRGDRLAVRKGEGIDYVEGVISGITKEHVNFELDGESIPVKWSKLAGLLFADRPSRQLSPAKCQLTMQSGAQVSAASWKSTPRGVAIQLPCGLTLDIPYQRLRRINFSQGKVTYLSEMTPSVTEWSPYLTAGKLEPLLARFYGSPKDPATDGAQAVTSDRLEIATLPGGSSNESPQQSTVESYTEGLSLQSRSRLIYDLPAEARRFEARVGIDAASVEIGNVQFKIRGDGRLLYAEEISGSTGPRDVSVDVAGLRRLELIVDYGKNQDTGDRLNLCNARIVK